VYGDRAVLINKGIGGNRVLHAGGGLFRIFGEAAHDRLDRDVLSIPGVTTAIVALGTNDIGQAKRTSKEYVTADQRTAGLRDMVERMTDCGIKVVGTTLLPRLGSFGYKGYHEVTRNAVNDWIRSYDGFDYVIDFDAATRSADDPDRLQAQYDCGDHLHPSSAGGTAMAEAIDIRKLV
jgi:lysophospholipase L1-like esterase